VLEAEVELASGERGECEAGELPEGVCTIGFGGGTALIGGVVMTGVLTDGTLTGPTVTGGVVTDGTVTAGTLTVGVGTLADGVGMLTVGADASEEAAATSSAPHTASAATTRTDPPPDRSATEGLDIAHRLRTGPLRSAREPLARVHHGRLSGRLCPGSGSKSPREASSAVRPFARH
jgi:X-X-X-Leu-X-X-Gly heptad repeat protein